MQATVSFRGLVWLLNLCFYGLWLKWLEMVFLTTILRLQNLQFSLDVINRPCVAWAVTSSTGPNLSSLSYVEGIQWVKMEEEKRKKYNTILFLPLFLQKKKFLVGQKIVLGQFISEKSDPASCSVAVRVAPQLSAAVQLPSRVICVLSAWQIQGRTQTPWKGNQKTLDSR